MLTIKTGILQSSLVCLRELIGTTNIAIVCLLRNKNNSIKEFDKYSISLKH